jgi:proteasome lid subunit RPN8/RPN11
LFRQLRRRGGGGLRESGAFLLGRRKGNVATVEELVFYDDIDPTALATGIVRLSGHAMNTVWQRCSERGLEAVADIHTHPGGSGQSRSDRDHPMVSTRGHVALIAPRFARSAFDLRGIGVYRYAGSNLWHDLPSPRPGWTGIRIRGDL